MRVLTSFYQSLSNLSWLKAQKKNAGHAWGYFFLLNLVLAVLFTIPVALALPGIFSSAKDEVVAKLPAFTATVRNGELGVTNIPQPFIAREDSENQMVFVLDTVSTSTQHVQEYVREGESGMLVSKKTIEFYNAQTGQGQTRAWSEVGDFSITKEDVVNWMNKYVTPAILPLVIFVMLLAVFIGFSVSKLVVLLIVTLIVYSILRIAKKSWSFGDLFTVGLFAQTLPSLIALILPWLGVGLTSIFFLALLAFMLSVVFTKDGSEMPVNPS